MCIFNMLRNCVTMKLKRYQVMNKYIRFPSESAIRNALHITMIEEEIEDLPHRNVLAFSG